MVDCGKQHAAIKVTEFVDVNFANCDVIDAYSCFDLAIAFGRQNRKLNERIFVTYIVYNV